MKATISARAETVNQDWLLIDATQKILGRLAREIAHRLRGKHKPIYTPHVDTGDFVVVIHADKIRVTGRKETQKTYYRHSGYPGGLKEETFDKMMAKDPEKVLRLAVKGMLPRGPLGRAMLRKLKIYVGAEHPHQAQEPKLLELQNI